MTENMSDKFDHSVWGWRVFYNLPCKVVVLNWLMRRLRSEKWACFVIVFHLAKKISASLQFIQCYYSVCYCCFMPSLLICVFHLSVSSMFPRRLSCDSPSEINSFQHQVWKLISLPCGSLGMLAFFQSVLMLFKNLGYWRPCISSKSTLLCPLAHERHSC